MSPSKLAQRVQASLSSKIDRNRFYLSGCLRHPRLFMELSLTEFSLHRRRPPASERPRQAHQAIPWWLLGTLWCVALENSRNDAELRRPRSSKHVTLFRGASRHPRLFMELSLTEFSLHRRRPPASERPRRAQHTSWLLGTLWCVALEISPTKFLSLGCLKAPSFFP